MKIIITESQLRLIRRIPEIKSQMDEFMEFFSQKDYYHNLSFNNFVLTVAENVGDIIATNNGLTGDEWVIFRNQIKQFIRNYFYEDMKNFWDKNR
jgi:hypothetical protein